MTGPPSLTSLLVAAFAVLFFGWIARTMRRRNAADCEALVRAERERIARDLHDVLAHGLTGVLLHAEAGLSDPDPERASRALRMVKRLARETFLDTKRVLLELRPDAFEHGRLVEALRRMVITMTEGLPVTAQVVVDGTPRALATHDAEQQLFRIAQEGVTNAVRHAHARRIDVAVRFERSRVMLLVRDDGAGPGTSRLDERGAESGGLRGMRERAEAIGGHWSMARRPGGGMEIWVDVPA